jgi:hypothetical protein
VASPVVVLRRLAPEVFAVATQVYANNMAVSCKAASGKTICAFPDVCFTPPENPATPPGVPIPYPNTGLASDTTDGSKTVKIGGEEVGLKDKSCFKKSSGDEAGCAAKKGVVTSTNGGKVFFKAWSMDVKIEGENAVRHLDLTTNNHASDPGDTPPWPYVDGAAIAAKDPCKKEKKKVRKACSPEKDWKKNCPPPPTAPHHANEGEAPAEGTADYAAYQELLNDYEQQQYVFARQVEENPCLRARRCMLVPKKEKVKSGPKGECCPGQTPHHIIDGASFTGMTGWGQYDYDAAACVCCEGTNQTTATHGQIHLRTGVQCQELSTAGNWNRSTATTAGARSVRKTFPGSGCSQKCLEAQINKSHDDAKDNPAAPDSPIRPVAQSNMAKEPEWRRFARADMRF